MPRILASATALPPHDVSQEEVRKAAAHIFSGRIADLDRALRVFDNARIDRRQFMMPLPWYLQAPSHQDRHRVYTEGGLDLLKTAAARALTRAGLAPADIAHVIFVSSTGHAAPTLDAFLINHMGFSESTSRLPIWGLGCAAGAAGLARAYDYCTARPEAVVLLVALECCSLTFMPEDLSMKNLVGAAIFADGAAAVVVAGEGATSAGPRILATRSHLFPDTYRIMGWDFLPEGMRLVLSPRLPALVRSELPRMVDAFLEDMGLIRHDLVHYLTHPGGARVVDAFRHSLGLFAGELDQTEEILRRHGNLSSVSVLAVLERWFDSPGRRVPGHALLSAFGPGFSAEMLLLEV